MSKQIINNMPLLAAIAFGCSVLSGCAVVGSAGPSTRAVIDTPANPHSDIKLIDVTGDVAQRLIMNNPPPRFSDELEDAPATGSFFGPGDTVDISIWEAPPGVLFNSTPPSSTSANTIARAAIIPEQMVDNEGYIVVPFVGPIRAAGKTPNDIAREITIHLAGKAHDPQVVVRRVANVTASVTVVGDVAINARLPLSAKGERLLDALAAAGGSRQPVGKSTIQITRGKNVVSMPLDAVIRDPQQNITLKSGDVITVLFQPYSFTALGALGANAEVNFEGSGITLSQALGRVGGLQDQRSDLKGVFVFRWENANALNIDRAESAHLTADGRIPVIYRINMKNPEAFFISQNFPIRNKDILYASNAPSVDLQKFLSIVSTSVFSIVNIGAAVQ